MRQVWTQSEKLFQNVKQIYNNLHLYAFSYHGTKDYTCHLEMLEHQEDWKHWPAKEVVPGMWLRVGDLSEVPYY